MKPNIILTALSLRQHIMAVIDLTPTTRKQRDVLQKLLREVDVMLTKAQRWEQ